MRTFAVLALLVASASAVPRPTEEVNEQTKSDGEDICSLPPINPAQPFQCTAFFPRWTFDQKAGKCVSYIYGGCGKTENLFETELECIKRCDRKALLRVPKAAEINPICSQPLTVGPCKGFKPRFFYNAETAACERFNFGGCKGNDNNFETLEECQAACSVQSAQRSAVQTLPAVVESDGSQDRSICSLPAVPGDKQCFAFIPAWTFNSNSGKCEKFIYGGCGKSENVFPSEQACNARCGTAASS